MWQDSTREAGVGRLPGPPPRARRGRRPDRPGASKSKCLSLIHTDANPYFMTTGIIDATYGIFRVSPDDPVFDPDTDIISLDNRFSNPASVTVDHVPEPATFLLLGAGVGGLVFWRRREARRNASK